MMLKLYNNNLIGYCETGRSEFGLYGQDTQEVFKSIQLSQPAEWKYNTSKVFYDRNSCGHRSKEIENLDKEFLLFVGCSITVGSAVALEETFPNLVSNELKTDYYNLAVEGAGYDLIAYNITNWFKNIKRKPSAVIIKWPQLYRTFRINGNDVIPIGPWNCKKDIGKAITEEQWKAFESVTQTDYFSHYGKIVKDSVEALLAFQNIKVITVEDIDTVDFGRDLKHPGSKTHSLFASNILNSLGQ